MKLIFKIVIAGIILMILAIVGVTALVGGAVNSVDKSIKADQAKYGMSKAEFKSIKPGIGYKQMVAKYGKPDPAQTQRTETQGMKDLTVYYNIKGGQMLDMYQFVFVNGKLESKSKF